MPTADGRGGRGALVDKVQGAGRGGHGGAPVQADRGRSGAGDAAAGPHAIYFTTKVRLVNCFSAGILGFLHYRSLLRVLRHCANDGIMSVPYTGGCLPGPQARIWCSAGSSPDFERSCAGEQSFRE